jgi:hypothetical protein
MAFGNETYEINLNDYNYGYNNYTRNQVVISFGKCLRNRLFLTGCAMRFTIRSLGVH